jgi:hypothetical protein
MPLRLRLSLDTSGISARADDRLPERRQATIEFRDRFGACAVCSRLRLPWTPFMSRVRSRRGEISS